MSTIQTTKPKISTSKLLMVLFLISISMIFAGFTSAYLVRKAEGNWREFDIPSSFYWATLIIVLSSFSFHWAYLSAKKSNISQTKNGLYLTSILGLGFLASIWTGYIQLVENKVHLVGNPSESFFYIISGLHALHVVSALIFLLIVLIQAHKINFNAKNLNTLENCLLFWHYLDLLWIYLFVFLLLNRS